MTRKLFYFAIVLMFGLTALAVEIPELSKDDVKKYARLASGGYKSLKKGHYDSAIRFFKKQIDIYDGSGVPHYNLACAYSLKGREEKALAWLSSAIERGYRNTSHMMKDTDLDNIKSMKEFEELIALAESFKEKWQERDTWAAAPEDVKRFDDVRGLIDYFSDQQKKVNKVRGVIGWDTFNELSSGLRREKVASIEHYLDSHPNAPDKEIWEWQRLKTFAGAGRWLENADAEKVVTAAEAFMDDYFQSAHYAHALRLKAGAYCSMKVNKEIQGEEVGDLEEKFSSDLEHLGYLTKSYPGASIASENLIFLTKHYADMDEPEEAKQYAGLLEEHYGTDEKVMRMAKSRLFDVLVKINGMQPFSVAGIDGEELSLETFKGEVTLIDFWATWCGPCLGELPHLKKAYAEYHDKGFDIVGISLDYEKRMPLPKFKKWLVKNGLEWHQFYDGKGWGNSVAKLYNVYAIPFAILLDRKGEVRAVNLRGETLFEKVGELVGE
jgi:thiol-disulfide isomerase/thioredoxin